MSFKGPLLTAASACLLVSCGRFEDPVAQVRRAASGDGRVQAELAGLAARGYRPLGEPWVKSVLSATYGDPAPQRLQRHLVVFTLEQHRGHPHLPPNTAALAAWVELPAMSVSAPVLFSTEPALAPPGRR